MNNNQFQEFLTESAQFLTKANTPREAYLAVLSIQSVLGDTLSFKERIKLAHDFVLIRQDVDNEIEKTKKKINR